MGSYTYTPGALSNIIIKKNKKPLSVTSLMEKMKKSEEVAHVQRMISIDGYAP